MDYKKSYNTENEKIDEFKFKINLKMNLKINKFQIDFKLYHCVNTYILLYLLKLIINNI